MSDTVDWLKKISSSKAKVSFDLEEEEDEGKDVLVSSAKLFKKPAPNAIRKAPSYSSKDLAGLKVAHDLDSFRAGETDILVLEDVSVLNNNHDGDESSRDGLVSMSLKETDRLKRLREVARHASGYSGYKAYEEEDESVITFGSGGDGLVRPSKVLQKYDFATTDFSDEPSRTAGFVLGKSQAPEKASESSQRVVSGEFDTVHNSGVSILDSMRRQPAKSTAERDRKRAKKLTRAFFSDEPEMFAEAAGEGEQLTAEAAIEEEDNDLLDMQRIISATRREHLKSAKTFEAVDEEEESSPAISGKSFDALIMSESIFNDSSNEGKSFDALSFNDNNAAAELEDEAMTSLNVGRVGNYGDLRDDAFSAEPLVRNGVASTLSLLKMRGINLVPRSSSSRNVGQPTSPASDIKLEYFDQFGNRLNSKEAYKELSRKFHGKGPGKGKIEKMKKRREETNKMESLSASDANQSAIVTNLRKQQVESGAPYMILSHSRNVEENNASVPALTVADQSKKPKIFGLQLKKT
jgi:hypothetical protein